MTKIGKIYRDKITKKLQDGVEKESSAFVINFRNVSSAEICTLRKTLQQKKAKVYMSRNSLARVGLKASVLAPITDNLDGQTLFIWTSADPVDVAKILVKFADKKENIVLRGGVVTSQLLKKEDMKRLSDLPAKEVLLAQLLGTLQSPMTRLARALNGKTVELLSVLKQISEKTGGN